MKISLCCPPRTRCPEAEILPESQVEIFVPIGEVNDYLKISDAGIRLNLSFEQVELLSKLIKECK